MQIKKLRILVIITLAYIYGAIQYSNAKGFQDGLYCTIKDKKLTISLKKESNYLCKNYLLYLQNRIYREQKEINKTNQLIKEGDNKVFRINIKEKKIKTIKEINILIKKIIYNTNNFEKNIIKEIQKYIKKNLDKEINSYKKIIRNFLYLPKLKKSNEIIQILQNKTKKIIEIIGEIQTTTTMDNFIKKFTQYFYLKKEIKGILES